MSPIMNQGLYAAAAEALAKMAEEDSRAVRGIKRGLGTLAASAGGMVLGAGAGLGMAYGAERLGLKLPAKYVVPAAGLLGMGTSAAHEAMQERQMREMKDALKRRKKNS